MGRRRISPGSAYGYGRTVALGDYEASADAILYELDADHGGGLRRFAARARGRFGAALLRLRKQRRLKRSDSLRFFEGDGGDRAERGREAACEDA